MLAQIFAHICKVSKRKIVSEYSGERETERESKKERENECMNECIHILRAYAYAQSHQT